MKNFSKPKLFLLTPLIILTTGCVNIPPESALLNQKIYEATKNLHESNAKLINYYFDQKILHINQLQDEAIEHFIHKIATATQLPDASPLGESELNRIKDAIKKIYDKSEYFKALINQSRGLVLKKIHEDHAILQKANLSITNLLESSSKLDRSQSMLLKDIEYRAINFTEINRIVDNLLYSYKDGSISKIEPIKNIKQLLEIKGNK